MQQGNRREAVRVPCEVPVRIEAEDAPQVVASLVDVSRTGLRIRLSGSVLGVHRLSSLAQIARRASALLGDSFLGELHFEHLGPLIRKQLRTVRVAKRDWEHADVELGCLITDGHLTDLEATLLGVHLPPVGAEEEAPEAAPSEPAALRAYLYASDEHANEPIVARTGALTRGMAMLTVEEGADHLRTMDVTSVAVALDDAFGSEVTLRIADGTEDLWVGPAEIKEVDVDDEASGEVKLGVAFGRELRAEELKRLGLPSPA
jgi:hypothetical protein